MTEDYKEYVLKHITGNLPQESSVVQPQFEDISVITNNLKTQIRAYFDSIVVYADFVPSKNNKNQDLEYSVLACNGTLLGQSDMSGAFVILDKEYNIVQVITHYSDGSLIGVLSCLNVDEKGNFYAIDYVGSNYRIVLMNNLVLKPSGSNTYQAIKIDTHTIPNTYSWESMLKIFKNDGNNKYFAVGNRNNSAGIVGCELTIEDTDTWTYYTSTRTKVNAYSLFDNGYNVYWDSNSELHFQIAINFNGLIMLSKGTGTTMAETIYLGDSSFSNESNFVFYTNQIGYYASVENKNSQTFYTLYKAELETAKLTTIYQEVAEETLYPWFWLFKNNNGVYFIRSYRTDDDTHTFNLSFGVLNNKIVYEEELGTFSASSFLNAFCYPNVITEFNRNYVFIQNQDTLFSLNFIWKSNGYNGEPYVSSASLVPEYITIEDENEKEIFNRNIYNLSSYSNWYTATVQIPNYFLNNTQLYNSMLYSQGNNLLASKNIDATKNIYEELYINFMNKFNVIDNDINFENIYVASELVYSMLNRITSRHIGKYVINYHDETTETKSISTDLTYDNLKTTMSLVVYTNKLIDSIDIISQDEVVLYKTINCSNLELNKYYLISFDIRVE